MGYWLTKSFAGVCRRMHIYTQCVTSTSGRGDPQARSSMDPREPNLGYRLELSENGHRRRQKRQTRPYSRSVGLAYRSRCQKSAKADEAQSPRLCVRERAVYMHVFEIGPVLQ
jgi:hypothetical protein